MPPVTPSASRLAQHLRHDLLAHVVRPRDAGDQNGHRHGQQQRGDLRHQSVADGEQRVGAPRVGERHAVLGGADDRAAEQIDEYDQDAGDGVAPHELAGAVHGAVEVGLLAHLLTADDGLRLGDDAGIQIGVDRHLPARHRVQGEARAHFRDPAGALGDHHEIDDHEHHEHDHAYRVIAAHDELAERGDDMARRVRAGMAVDQHDAGRGDVEPQAQQGRAQQHRRKGGEFQRPPHIDHGQQDHERQGDVESEEDIEQECRQRQHHHGENHHDQQRHAEPVAGELAEGCYRGARAHTSSNSLPTCGLGRATLAATVGFRVRTLKM